MAVNSLENIMVNFHGIYHIEVPETVTCTNHTVMKSIANDVMFCGDFTPDATGVLGVLDEDVRPGSALAFPALVGETEFTVVPVSVSTDGTVSVPAGTEGLIHMNGLQFHINSGIYSWDDAQGDGGEDAG